jgi:hypothetical protein
MYSNGGYPPRRRFDLLFAQNNLWGGDQFYRFGTRHMSYGGCPYRETQALPAIGRMNQGQGPLWWQALAVSMTGARGSWATRDVYEPRAYSGGGMASEYHRWGLGPRW